MPLQIYANPNLGPQLQMQGAHALGGGIGSGLSRLGEAYGQLQEKKKQESQETTSLRKLAELRGWAEKDDLNMMNLGELRGLHMGKSEEESAKYRQAQREHLEAQTALQRYQQENQQRAPSFLGELAKYGADPGVPYNQEAIDKYSAPLGLRQYAQAAADTWYAPEGDPLRALEKFAPAPPPFSIPPDHVSDGFSIDSSGKATQTFKPKKTEAPVEPWILSDNVEEFKKGLRGVKDTNEAKAILERRNSYEQALGRPSLLERVFLGELKPSAPAPVKTEPKYEKGDRAVQNGKTYVYDGKQWNQVE